MICMTIILIQYKSYCFQYSTFPSFILTNKDVHIRIKFHIKILELFKAFNMNC